MHKKRRRQSIVAGKATCAAARPFAACCHLDAEGNLGVRPPPLRQVTLSCSWLRGVGARVPVVDRGTRLVDDREEIALRTCQAPEADTARCTDT